MKKIMFFTIAVSSFLVSNAQVEGPNSGSVFGTAPIPGSNVNIVWVNTANAAASDNVYATFGNLAGTPAGSYSDYLIAGGFGFGIPPGSTIDGIIVEVERSDNFFKVSDYSIRIIKNNIISTTERSTGQSYPFSDSYQTVGNPSDLWGETWTVGDINATGFGVGVAVQRSAPNGTSNGRVDHIRIFVFYTLPILSVNFFTFTGTVKKKIIQLVWTTKEEINMSHYEVERSTDGMHYSSLFNVKSKNNTDITAYSVNDENPVTGRSFYRIKSFENNGKVKYSKIISVNFKPDNIIQLYPNPWKRGTVLHVSNPLHEKLQILFYDNLGKFIGTGIVNGSDQITTTITANNTSIIFYRAMNSKGEVKGSGTLLLTD